jgi:hypothetical protein
MASVEAPFVPGQREQESRPLEGRTPLTTDKKRTYRDVPEG